MKQRKRRRQYPLINKSHQYGFMAIILSYNMILVIFLSLSLFLPDIIQLEDESLSFEVRTAAADKMLTIHSRIWPAVIGLICLIGLHSFRVFHRFVGPLYRFVITFEKVRDGDLSDNLVLRKKDYLHQEATVFNEMMEMLREKMRATQSVGLDALKSLGELEQSVDSGTSLREADKELLAILRQKLNTLMNTVEYFRVQNSDQEQGGTRT